MAPPAGVDGGTDVAAHPVGPSNPPRAAAAITATRRRNPDDRTLVLRDGGSPRIGRREDWTARSDAVRLEHVLEATRDLRVAVVVGVQAVPVEPLRMAVEPVTR